MPPPVVAILGLLLSGSNLACNAVGVWDIANRVKKDRADALPSSNYLPSIPPPPPAEDRLEAIQRHSRQFLSESWSILSEFGEQFGLEKYQIFLKYYRELRAHYHKAHESPLSREEMQHVFENVLKQSSFFHNELLRESDLIRTQQAMQRIEEMKAVSALSTKLAHEDLSASDDSMLDSDLD
ncbi:hypothetical protein VKT23_019692 [Stygiomarasmius scandens]|uniref:Uncharacterized protein n=1 Tax=Marasmiellus scandens TaxID=2682957 RepID=A0ABR1INS5_9AGAR